MRTFFCAFSTLRNISKIFFRRHNYFKNIFNSFSVPLGSTRDMPAVSCEEVKASEGEAALCKNWVKPNSSAETTLINCYLEAKGWFVWKQYNQRNQIQANRNKDCFSRHSSTFHTIQGNNLSLLWDLYILVELYILYSSTVYRMIFPSRSNESYALNANAIKKNLTSLTLCLFAKHASTNPLGHQTVYSYATSTSDNMMYIDTSSPTIYFSIYDTE